MRKRVTLVFVGFLLIGVLIYLALSTGWLQNWAPIQISALALKASPLQGSEAPATNLRPTLTPFQPNTNTPASTASPTITLTPIPSATSTQFPTYTPSATPEPTFTPTPLDAAEIVGIIGYGPAYSLNCEARSAVDWAGYFGVQVNEITFYNELPISDDPDLGFVGNVHEPWGQTPPNGYGVHAAPVAKLLREYGLKAVSARGVTWDEVRSEISQGNPVIVWVIGRVTRGTPVVYTSYEGKETTVARFEHTVILTGYTKTEVTVLDGNWVYKRSLQDFLESWGVLGNMAVMWSNIAGAE
jgi:uncharacterized protein YvpB